MKVTIPDTERLTFSFVTANNASDLFELNQDPAVMKYINGGSASSWDDINHHDLPRLTKFSNPEKGWGLWKVNTRQDNTFIGWVLARPIDFFSDSPQWQNIELGWRFKKASWGQGYATEAASAVFDVLKKNPEHRLFTASAIAENTGSINVMKKIGMQFLKDDSEMVAGKRVTVKFYQLTTN